MISKNKRLCASNLVHIPAGQLPNMGHGISAGIDHLHRESKLRLVEDFRDIKEKLVTPQGSRGKPCQPKALKMPMPILTKPNKNGDLLSARPREKRGLGPTTRQSLNILKQFRLTGLSIFR